MSKKGIFNLALAVVLFGLLIFAIVKVEQSLRVYENNTADSVLLVPDTTKVDTTLNDSTKVDTNVRK